MRILAYNWRDLAHPRAGGAEVYIHAVAREWIAQGHDVTLFCASVEGRPEREDVDGLHVVRRGGRFSVYREARRFYEREGHGRFDLVVDEVNTRPFLTPRYVADVPIVAIVHQVCREIWRYEMPLPIALLGRYWLEPRWLKAYRDVPVVTVSESSKESLEAYGLENVTVVPEGHDPLPRPRAVAREVAPTLLFVGRLSANKRPDHAIEAFRQVRRALPEAHLWVVGDGPMRRRLERDAPPGVSFFGRVDDATKRQLMARAHAVVATSVREGWGLVVTEAAEVGTPTIAYDLPGLRDSVQTSGGVLVAANPHALAARVLELLPRWERSLPDVQPGGVTEWSSVALRILAAPRLVTRHAQSEAV